jgi:hypothetical protein
MGSFRLRICDDSDKFKFIWELPEGDLPAYSIDAGTLKQAVVAVREQLRDIAFATGQFTKQEFADVLARLARRGSGLFQQLMPESGTGYPFDLRQRLEQVSRAPKGERQDFKIILETDKLFVPWGFVFSSKVGDLPSGAALTLSLADMNGFWLSHFNISIAYSANLPLPSERRATASKLFAVHEDMFDAARRSLEQDPVISRLDQLLGNRTPTTDWDNFFEQWEGVSANDSILYLYGHSDGHRIELRDKKKAEDIKDDPKFDLLASEFRKFRKRPDGSASIFLLNGCRTVAPEDGSRQVPISANFLKETRQPGYFGFIGTEAQVTNVFAFRYGTELLWRLYREGQSVGEAFDELLQDNNLFPQNLLYSCYADRAFRLSSKPANEKEP